MRNSERHSCASYEANYEFTSRHIDCPGKMQEIRDWSFGSYLEPMVVLCSSLCFTFSESPSVQNRSHFQGHLLDHFLMIEDGISITRHGVCKHMFSSKTLALVTTFH